MSDVGGGGGGGLQDGENFDGQNTSDFSNLNSTTIATELGLPEYDDVANAPQTQGRLVYATGVGVSAEGIYKHDGTSYAQVGGGLQDGENFDGQGSSTFANLDAVGTKALNNAVHVSEYGTDAAAFSAALADAEPGAAVIFDPLDAGAVYTLDAMVSVDKRVHIIQHGEVTVANGVSGAVGDAIITVTVPDVEVHLGYVDANGANNSGSFLEFDSAGSRSNNGDHGKVFGGVIANPSKAVEFLQTEGGLVLGTTVIDYHRHGLTAGGGNASGVRFIGCDLYNPGNLSNNYGIYQHGSGRDHKAIGCTVYGGTGCQQAFSTDTGVTGLEWVDCTADGEFTKRSFGFESVTDGTLDVTVRNNPSDRGVLLSATTDCQVRVIAKDTWGAGLHALNDEGSEIEAIVHRCGNVNWKTNTAGIFLEGCDDTHLKAGAAKDNQDRGIRITSSGNNASPSNNRVTDLRVTDTGSGSQGIGVDVAGACVDTVVLHNDLRGNVNSNLTNNGTGTVTDPAGQGTVENHNLV